MKGSRILACWGDRRCNEASPGWHSPKVQRGQRGERAVRSDGDQAAVQALQSAAGSLDEPTSRPRIEGRHRDKHLHTAWSVLQSEVQGCIVAYIVCTTIGAIDVAQWCTCDTHPHALRRLACSSASSSTGLSHYLGPGTQQVQLVSLHGNLHAPLRTIFLHGCATRTPSRTEPSMRKHGLHHKHSGALCVGCEAVRLAALPCAATGA